MHAQTERGLRQYLARALREGCTPRRGARRAADGLPGARAWPRSCGRRTSSWRWTCPSSSPARWAPRPSGTT
ncbi:MAG: hypothetical protein MZU91_08465 [Desulfosudis oleivorans]|nr:hypothetical protein [Desulfosudis oleivorans]